MRAISKELEQMLEAYSPLVQEGRQIAIGLLDGTVHLEKGRKEKHQFKFVFLFSISD
ncbi:hypothetical protein F6Y05_01660 (plasmid) [Bacillus megaterium]|nr:hypothetical protein [Priestia megaterium]